MINIRVFSVLFWLLLHAFSAQAQEGPFSFATIERPPFSSTAEGEPSGFSIDLMKAIANDLGRPIEFTFYDSFPAMLSATGDGLHDGAVANISITAERENSLDFSQPIFESGIGVLLPIGNKQSPIFQALLTRDFLLSVVIALGVLFGSGMLMWVFERRVQPYFDRPVRQALFPSFWWALNVVVNGGFEERQPQSGMGRLFAVVLVVSSLFVVSIFVATITSATTVAALQDNIDSINDLEGQRVATVLDSTSADFLKARDLNFVGYHSPNEIFHALENGRVDAVVFDAPILSYYSSITNDPQTRLMARIYRRENYGIALPSGSDLREDLNRSLLRIRENGIYDEIVQQWFGGQI